MAAGTDGAELRLEPNSRPYLLKRILSDGTDIAAVFLLYMLFTTLVLMTPLADLYHRHTGRAGVIARETLEAFQGDAEAAERALAGNQEYLDERFAANLHGYLLKALAVLLAELLILLLFPLCTKDRVTPGKKMTGVLLFDEHRQSPASAGQIAGRFLFVFFLDSLFLYLFTGTLTFLFVPVLRLIEMLLNRKHRTLQDLATGLTAIERLSYSGIGSDA